MARILTKKPNDVQLGLIERINGLKIKKRPLTKLEKEWLAVQMGVTKFD